MLQGDGKFGIMDLCMARYVQKEGNFLEKDDFESMECSVSGGDVVRRCRM